MNTQKIFACILMLISLTAFAQPAQPSRAKSYLEAGDRYYASRQFNQALPYFTEARRLALSAPQDVQVLLSLTHRYLAYRDEAAAWDCYDKGTSYAYGAFNQNPQWSRYWLTEALKYYNEQLAGLMNQVGTSQPTRTAIYNRATWVQNFLGGTTTPPPSTQGENNTALTGTTLTYYQRPSVGQCQADCTNNPNCKGYTWIQAGTYKTGDAAMCYLLSAVTGRNAATGHISGVKGGVTSGGNNGGGGGGTRITWGTNAVEHRGKNGQRFTYTCPAGSGGSVWGTDIYTDDSSICNAALHAGLLTTGSGGTVTIEIRPGQSSYTSTTRNGVGSTAFGVWHGSYVFVR